MVLNGKQIHGFLWINLQFRHNSFQLEEGLYILGSVLLNLPAISLSFSGSCFNGLVGACLNVNKSGSKGGAGGGS